MPRGAISDALKHLLQAAAHTRRACEHAGLGGWEQREAGAAAGAAADRMAECACQAPARLPNPSWNTCYANAVLQLVDASARLSAHVRQLAEDQDAAQARQLAQQPVTAGLVASLRRWLTSSWAMLLRGARRPRSATRAGMRGSWRLRAPSLMLVPCRGAGSACAPARPLHLAAPRRGAGPTSPQQRPMAAPSTTQRASAAGLVPGRADGAHGARNRTAGERAPGAWQASSWGWRFTKPRCSRSGCQCDSVTGCRSFALRLASRRRGAQCRCGWCGRCWRSCRSTCRARSCTWASSRTWRRPCWCVHAGHPPTRSELRARPSCPPDGRLCSRFHLACAGAVLRAAGRGRGRVPRAQRGPPGPAARAKRARGLFVTSSCGRGRGADAWAGTRCARRRRCASAPQGGAARLAPAPGLDGSGADVCGVRHGVHAAAHALLGAAASAAGEARRPVGPAPGAAGHLAAGERASCAPVDALALRICVADGCCVGLWPQACMRAWARPNHISGRTCDKCTLKGLSEWLQNSDHQSGAAATRGALPALLLHPHAGAWGAAPRPLELPTHRSHRSAEEQRAAREAAALAGFPGPLPEVDVDALLHGALGRAAAAPSGLAQQLKVRRTVATPCTRLLPATP